MRSESGRSPHVSVTLGYLHPVSERVVEVAEVLGEAMESRRELTAPVAIAEPEGE